MKNSIERKKEKAIVMIIYLQRVYKDKTKKDDNGLVENNFLSHLTHYNQIFIDNLKFFRKQKKLTQMELTLAIDKGYNYINGVEQGKLFPSVEVIEKLAEVLEISPAALFDENSVAKNIIKLNKEYLAEEISKDLRTALLQDFKKELTKILDSY